MPQFIDKYNFHSPTTQGLVVSSILITASLSSLAAGPLADRFSRTRTASLGGAVFCVGSIIAAAASNLAMLFVGRCIAGIGEGLFLSSAMVYLLEIAPTNLRGRLSCTQQLFVTLGIASGKFTTPSLVALLMMIQDTLCPTAQSTSLPLSRIAFCLSCKLLYLGRTLSSCCFCLTRLDGCDTSGVPRTRSKPGSVLATALPKRRKSRRSSSARGARKMLLRMPSAARVPRSRCYSRRTFADGLLLASSSWPCNRYGQSALMQ